MRVLVLTQVLVYPADAGPKMKTLEVLRYLAARHDVVYCTFVRSEQEERDAAELRKLCRRVVTVSIARSKASDARFMLESLLTGDSFLLRRDYRAAMRDAVARLLGEERMEAVHVDQLNMMRFVPRDWQGMVVLDEHNAVWQVVERLRSGARNPIPRGLLRREVRIIRGLEGDACRRARYVLAVSEHDREALCEVAGPSARINVVPITIDAQRFEVARMQRDPRPDRVFTIGTMFWPPNSEGVMWWLRGGYQRLRALAPSITYDIVGARPPQPLRALAANHGGVRVLGYVADAEPFWQQAAVLAVPLLSGGGVRVKILEAMARGVPVVSTTIGCEGLAVRDGEHVLIADTPTAFSEACARVLQERELAIRLSDNARKLVLEKYDAKVALRALDAIYGRASQPIHA